MSGTARGIYRDGLHSGVIIEHAHTTRRWRDRRLRGTYGDVLLVGIAAGCVATIVGTVVGILLAGAL